MRFLAALIVMVILVVLTAISSTPAQGVQGDIYVEASVDNPNPYVGQQITYNFKLYDAVGVTNPLYQPSDFEGFWHIDIGVVSQTNEEIKGRRYSVTTISAALYPTHSGPITIQPASVVLPETVFRSKEILTANPVSLEVKSLPETNSSGFNGAVGQFTMAATLDRQVVQVGEPVTMTLTLSGTGNVEQLPPPAVPNTWRTTINSGNYKSAIQNGVVIGTRDYQIVFIPASSGAQELPPITLDYFDPVGENYKSMSTSPIQIQVTGDTITPLNSPPDFSEPSLRLKPIVNLTTEPVNPLFMAIATILPICGVGMIAYQQRLKTRKANLRGKLRQQQALHVATKGLKAISWADTKVSYQSIDNVFKAYIADKLDMRLELVKQSDLLELLALNKATDGTLLKARSFISEIEEGVFSPTVDVISPEKYDEIVKRLRDIDKQWLAQ
jgi:hypothetical protein